jgi:hypothetical protein
VTDGPRTPSRVGRFQIREELGRGGVGVVYRAFDPDQQREVALKVLLAGEHASATDVERFLREARAAAGLDHPNLVRVRDAGWADGRPFLAMDLVRGGSLAEQLERRSFTPAEAAALVRDVARGLQHAHDRGVVHRDVKPSNVLFEPDGTPRLADFGLAAELGGDARLTRTGQLMGTPAYLPPEATRRAEPAPTVDVYSLGAVLYHALAGRPPYLGDTAVEVIYAVIEGPPPALGSVAPGAPAALQRVVAAAMAREPEARYPSCAALADDLDRYLGGRTVQPPSLGATVAVTLWVRRRRNVVAGFGLAAGSLGAAWLGSEAWRARVERLEEEARQEAAAAALAALGPTDRAGRLEAFALDPESRGTRAAARAWLELAAGAPDVDRRDTWWANAYADGGPTEQDEALRGLAASLRERWRFAALDGALDLLEARAVGAEDRADIASLRADAAIHGRDFAAGSAWLAKAGRPGPALVARWEHALPGGPADSAGSVGDTDRDGVLEWWHTVGAELLHTELSAEPHDVGRVGLPGPAWASDVLPGDPPLLVTSLGDPPRSVTVRDLAGAPLYEWVDSAHTDVVREGERLWVAIGAYGRHLVAVDRSADGGFRASRPTPEIDALGSDVMALASADLGDGGRSLIVATGAWSAYDLRVVDPRDGSTRWRTKHGLVEQVAVEPRPDGDHVWTVRDDRHPSKVVFPADRPSGGPAGLTEWRWTGGELVPVRFLEAPASGRVLLRNLVLADLDGDGVIDPAIGVGGPTDEWSTAVWPAGQHPPVLIGDTVPLVAADLPGSAPGAELIVRAPAVGTAGQWWALGVGGSTLPSAAPPPPGGEPPRDVTGGAARTWGRALALADMGLHGEAAALLDTVPDPRARSAAADLWEAAGRRSAALDSRLAAARELGSVDEFARAVASLRSAHRLVDAVTVADEGGVEVEPALRAAAAALRSVEIPTDAAFPGPAVVVAPQHWRRGPAAQVDVVTGGGALLELPLAFDGGELVLDLELDVARSEWGSGVVVEVPVGDSHLRAGVRVWGGGGFLRREVFCQAPGAHATGLEDEPASAVAPTRVAVRVAASALDGTWSCRLQRGDEVRHAGGALPGPLPGGRGRLTVLPSAHAGSPGLLMTTSLRRLSVTGAGLTAEAGAPPGADPVWLAADSGDWRALAAALPTDPPDGTVVELLRTRLSVAAPALRERWPERSFRWLDLAYGSASHAHPEDALLGAVWTSQTDGVEALLAGPDAELAARLVLRRARAEVRAGQLGVAHHDLALAARVLTPEVARRGGASLELALAHVEWATAASVAGDPRAEAARALAATYVPPEVVADLVAAARPPVTGSSSPP